MDESQAGIEEYVEFVRAGTHATGAFECTACGSQHVSSGVLPACPTCGDKLWERSTWSPFGVRLPTDPIRP